MGRGLYVIFTLYRTIYVNLLENLSVLKRGRKCDASPRTLSMFVYNQYHKDLPVKPKLCHSSQKVVKRPDPAFLLLGLRELKGYF